MVTNLAPQILDITITKITPKTVWYDLSRNGQSENGKSQQAVRSIHQRLSSVSVTA